MSESPKPHAAKKAHTKSAHAASAPAAATAAKVAAIPPLPPELAATPAEPDLATLAREASAGLKQIAASIPFYDPSAKDLTAARVATRVPVAALGIAATILEQDPARYPDFDAETTRGASDYVQAMTPLSQELSELQQRLARSIFNRHGQGATETLALYQTLKGLSRVSKGKDTLAQQKALSKAMVKTSKKKRATQVTGKELKAAAKSIKASKKAAAKNQQVAVASAEAQAASAAAQLAGGQPGAASTPAATPVTSTPAAAPVAPVAPTTSTTPTAP